MNIAICDDSLRDAQSLIDILREYERQNELPMKIDVYTSGEDFMRQSCTIYNVVFMDIYLPNITGVETAKTVRKSQKLHIVFLSASADFALDAIALDALHYIVKPINACHVEEVLKRLDQRIPPTEHPPVEVKTKSGTVYINPLKIIFIESYNKIALVHIDGQIYETYTTLSTFSALLDPAFFIKSQRSYLVNMEYIDCLSRDHIMLTDNTHITLSRTNRKEIKKVYDSFLFRQIRERKR